MQSIEEENTPAIQEQNDNTVEYWKNKAENRLTVAKHWYNETKEARLKLKTMKEEFVKVEKMLGEYTIAYNGEIRAIDGYKELALQENTAWRAAINGIDSIGKGKSKINIKLTSTIAAIIIVAMIFALYSANPKLQASINENILPIAICGIIIAAIILLVKKKWG